MSTKVPPAVFLEFKDAIVELPFEETVGYYVEYDDQPRVILPIQCLKCKYIDINSDTDLQSYDVDNTRDMGPDVYYSAEMDGFECEKCGSKLSFRLDISCYASSWSLDDMNFQGCQAIAIGSLGRILSQIYGKYVEVRGPRDVFDDDPIQTLQKEKEEKGDQSGYILVVEGIEDKLVWKALFQKKNINPEENGIKIVKGVRQGGRSEAIATYLAAKQILPNSPKKLVVDSDKDRKQVEDELKKHNLLESEYHILNAKEIESYLLDAEAISLVTGLDSSTIKEQIRKIERKGKEQLDLVFENQKMPKPDAKIKYFLARRLPEIPPELEQIMMEVMGRH